MIPRVEITQPAPARAATCADPPKPPPMDVVTLSAGLPDGVYFAGKQLTPWMNFEERIKLTEWECRVLRPARHVEAYQALKARRENESLVVRWEIEGGLPSVPVELWDVREADLEHEHRRYGYLWGACGHVDAYRLLHRLLDEALDHRAMGKSTNPYVERMEVVLTRACAKGNPWVLPARAIRSLAAGYDLRKAAKRLHDLVLVAKTTDVPVEEVLASLGITLSTLLDSTPDPTG